MGLPEVLQRLEEFKPNCRLVILDFAIRKGVFTPDQPRYLELVRALRAGAVV